MLNKIDSPGRSISESELKEIALHTELEFPTSYQEFLLKFNGGSPSPDAFPIKEYSEEVGGVQVFFGIDREIESSCLIWNYNEYKSRLPDSYIPIACSDTNDLICLVLSEAQYGKVVFWDAQDERSRNDLGNIYQVADSFEQLLEILFED
ncbi:SMI1/KNR4 family protein [Vibrio neptunius]|uniref:SMI1/KNR4 family protein n=1 Tax=Vibrio neptunius TaxID=170651 RepID=UPI0019D15D60|nr:SMI1/KNR4 family protein [Vibrio neptunius]MBN3575899.1 SMI1/KNR4 family protein [Vibrio neptunius]